MGHVWFATLNIAILLFAGLGVRWLLRTLRKS